QRTYQRLRSALVERRCLPDAVQQSKPARLALYRFPFGACNAQALDAVNNAGFAAIQWDVSTGDPDPHVSAAGIARQITRSTRPGSIIIGHANGRGWNTLQGLALAIPQLKAEGYQFVTVSELLAAGTPETVQSCYNLRPGDTDRYDILSGVRRLQRTTHAALANAKSETSKSAARRNVRGTSRQGAARATVVAALDKPPKKASKARARQTVRRHDSHDK
ncbi:MAG: hypothetical protein ACRCS9_12030, partial [Hyphomicrobium sp.]